MIEPTHPARTFGDPVVAAFSGSIMHERPYHLEDKDLVVFVLAVVEDEQELRKLMGDWQRRQGRPESFEWLVKRLDVAGYPPPWQYGEGDDHRPSFRERLHKRRRAHS